MPRCDRPRLRPHWQAWLSALLFPVRPEERAATASAWKRLPASQRHALQLLGRSTAGCAATIGLHEGCDLACSACYLPAQANAAPPLPLEQVTGQLRRIREHLGPGGQVQITSGEVTLLPDEHLLAILAAARELELAPMLMTHGQGLLEQPERLERLVREGGLERLAIHIDSTQYGRPGQPPVAGERDLDPLRERASRLVADTRRRTGRRLMLAHTVTVTADNLTDVPHLVRWAARHADTVSLLSLQPVARVGRTRARPPNSARTSVEQAGRDPPDSSLGAAVETATSDASTAPLPPSVTSGATRSRSTPTDPVWGAVCRGAGVALDPSGWRFGHAACNSLTLVLVLETGGEPDLFELRRSHSALETWVWKRTLARLGGWSRNEPQAATRLAGRLLRHPVLVASAILALLWRLLVEHRRVARLAAAIALGRRWSLRPLFLVLHRFMDAEELATPEGAERLASCSFGVPVEGRMQSMCVVNAHGLRDDLIRRWRGRANPPSAAMPDAMPSLKPDPKPDRAPNPPAGSTPDPVPAGAPS